MSGAVTVARLEVERHWRPIPHCPGRFVLASPAPPLTPRELVGPGVPLDEYRCAGARDPVIVARLSDGGVISYARDDGTFVHTLNTVAGFERKLAALGIAGAGPSGDDRG